MNKRRWIASVFVVIGAVLILSALFLFLHNEQESNEAGESAESALNVIREVIESNQEQISETDPVSSTEPSATDTQEPTEPAELKSVKIGGYDYIGYLSIPYFELELPVLDGYSDEMLRIAPCLQYGSPLTNDAVIAGHNYEKHFRALHTIKLGEYVTFTDMNGYVIEYGVVEVKTIDPTSVYEVIESEYDLILYTCTIGGRSRVIVCCDRLEPMPED